MEKKFLIPTVLGVLFLCGIIFTVVYKKTSGPSPNDEPVVQTLAPKETEPIEWTNMIFIFLLSYLNISYINTTYAYKVYVVFLCLSKEKSPIC